MHWFRSVWVGITKKTVFRIIIINSSISFFNFFTFLIFIQYVSILLSTGIVQTIWVGLTYFKFICVLYSVCFVSYNVKVLYLASLFSFICFHGIYFYLLYYDIDCYYCERKKKTREFLEVESFNLKRMKEKMLLCKASKKSFTV